MSQIKNFLVKLYFYFKNKPVFLLTVLALSYLARLLFRLLISTHGGTEENTIESPQPNTDSQDTTTFSECVQQTQEAYAEYIVEVTAHTNRFGVVFEDKLLANVQNFICQEAVWRNAYLEYRKKVWSRFQENRLDPAFDAFWYDPNNSDLLRMGVKEGSDTGKDKGPQENQENGVTSSD